MEAVTESTAKLQLDEETGEMVSKGELKKRLAKRAKKAAAEKAKSAKDALASAVGASSAKPTPKAKPEEVPIDPNAMFKQGWLQEVYKERPQNPVVTRFPPEPNGYLHIGHSKAIAINFGFAKHHGGVCYLRFDDTNPEKEEEAYFTAIEEMVRWLGFSPFKITYSSDHFQELYDLAEKLIGLDKAYVCECDDVQIKLQRGGEKGSSPRYRCDHGNKQTIEENLTKFRDMRDGKYPPRAAFLRMKQDYTNPSPQMWDLAAYRIKTDTPHHRTGWTWKIYPTYDFTHCLCDSFENISHSLCTTEFIQARESYEWLNKSLGVYEPMQREYGRLSLTGTILSKRKILKMVQEGIVRGWDDPRLYTLIGIKRRGVPPGAILDFVNELGVTTSATTIQIKRFEQSVRRYLERTVPRLMMVLDPIPVVIEDAEAVDVDLPFSPKDPKMGSHNIKFTPTVYIDRSDFREEDSKDFFRLAPGKTVGLLNAPYPIKATSFTKDDTGEVTEIRAVFDKESKKPKAFIHWVGTEGARKVEARIHNALFKSEKPDDLEGGFLNDLNPESEVIYPDALIESGIDEVKRRAPWPEAAGESELGKGGPESVRFQAIRLAYFAMDCDSTDDKLIFNRIVSLKEDVGKN